MHFLVETGWFSMAMRQCICFTEWSSPEPLIFHFTCKYVHIDTQSLPHYMYIYIYTHIRYTYMIYVCFISDKCRNKNMSWNRQTHRYHQKHQRSSVQKPKILSFQTVGSSESPGNVDSYEQWKRAPGCLGYIGDDTTQLCGDYNKPFLYTYKDLF